MKKEEEIEIKQLMEEEEETEELEEREEPEDQAEAVTLGYRSFPEAQVLEPPFFEPPKLLEEEERDETFFEVEVRKDLKQLKSKKKKRFSLSGI